MRLIVDEPAPGPWNMAVDAALLASAEEAERPTLRFYGWSSATLSLGYFQPLAERRRHAASIDCPVVRRATGGGAIVHDRELTYSYTAPLSDRFASHAARVYDLIHEALIDSLAALGIEAHQWGNQPTAGESPPAFLCFQRRSEHDVLVAGAKVAGSAQRRRHGALLQHGSLLLAKSECAAELDGLAELVGRQVFATDMVERWSSAIARRLNMKIQSSELSSDEKEAAKTIETNTFGAPCWTSRR
ncbi:MAG: lipoate--protein ligase family protein [Pirellulaceae bacterium]